jgi:hypothetical protein
VLLVICNVFLLLVRTAGCRREGRQIERVLPGNRLPRSDLSHAMNELAVKRRGRRRYDHPVVGEITLDWDALTSGAESDQQLVVYTAKADPVPSRRFASSRCGRRTASLPLADARPAPLCRVGSVDELDAAPRSAARGRVRARRPRAEP